MANIIMTTNELYRLPFQLYCNKNYAFSCGIIKDKLILIFMLALLFESLVKK